MQIEINRVSIERTPAKGVTLLWLVTGAVLLVLLSLAGLLVRLQQTMPDLISSQAFYAVLTLHGSGMVGMMLTVSAAIFWYLMHPSLPLSVVVMRVVFVLTLAGMALMTIATFNGFGTGWSILYPLPSTPGPVPGWPRWAAIIFIIGFATVISAFALWSLDYLRAGVARYGSLSGLLGFDILTGTARPGRESPSPAAIAGAVAAIDGVVSILPGTLVVGLMLMNLMQPSFTLNPLLAKNLAYFSGHVLVNVQMFLGAGIAYTLLPRYAGRSWPTTRLTVIGWLMTAVLMMLATFHHLYQDPAQPVAAQVVGAIASYGTAFPSLFVTILGGAMLVYRSGMRWGVAPLFLYLALAAWAIGGYAAVLDSTPWLNHYLHNTLWIPAYVHTFMVLGVGFFVLGGVYAIMPELTGRSLREAFGRRALLFLVGGGWGFFFTWYVSGAYSQPRRYPFHLDSLSALTWVGTGFALLMILGLLAMFTDFLWSVLNYARSPGSGAS